MSVISFSQCIALIEQQLSGHELYFGHGTDNAWDEACWLVETLTLRSGIAHFDENTLLDQSLQNEIIMLALRRVEQKLPLAYLLGEAWFANLCFNIDSRVLVPRSPIAELVLNEFEPLLPHVPLRILDLCTGSGCIGIATAIVFPQAVVDLADLSLGALEVAQSNIDKYDLNDRVRTVCSDMFKGLTGTYDLIISNPPYISSAEYQKLPEEYHQEPKLGLVSESDGMAIPVHIIETAADFLSPGGVLILEVGHGWSVLADLYAELPMLWLDFEFGGEGVCMLNLEQLSKHKV